MTTVATQIEVFHSPKEWDTLRNPWEELLAMLSWGINDLDVTAGFDWAMTLWKTHLRCGKIELLVLREDGQVCAILPLYRFNKKIRYVPCRSIAPLTDLYSGRSGFLLRKPKLEYLATLLDHACNRVGRSDAIQFTLVNGSVSEGLFLEWARRNTAQVQILNAEKSPYALLKQNWQQHFESLPSKLRTKLRSGEKRLLERGDLTYREFRAPEEVPEFNKAVQEIEVDSWKAAVGSAIASNAKHEAFHMSLALRAAEQGWFSGHLLFLNNDPIAYINGLLYNGVFLSLKTSYRSAYRDMSPGHVLIGFSFRSLYQRSARIYDFTGECEDYKMRWSDDTYCRTTYLVLNNTLRGTAARWLRAFGTAANERTSNENSQRT
jgi:CelD/BcsL family acetyltransferase involved in cellulose biosynthesis